MEPVRVLNVFTILNRGGAETMVMNYYRHMDRTKVQFDFLVHREEKGAYEDEITALGGRIYRMCPIYPQNFAQYKRRISEFFDEHPEYHIIHSHMSELGYFVFMEAAKRGIPVRICHAHGSPVGWDLKMFVRTYFKIRMRKFTTHMFACGPEASDWLFGKKNRRRVQIVNNAIDTERFRYSKESREQVRKELGITGKLVIGNVANFTRPKNHSFLIDVFAEVNKKRQDAMLVLVGDGTLKNEIMEKVYSMNLQKKVIFLGGRDDVADIMQAMDVFLFPSLWEGFPVTIIEAQTAGLPCVISDRITKTCIISEDTVVINLNQAPELWADKILTSVIEKNRENEFQKVVTAGYDIRINAERMEKFYAGFMHNIEG